MTQLSSSPLLFFTLLLALVSLIVSVAALVSLLKLNRLKTLLLQGSQGTDLEEVLHYLHKQQQNFAQDQSAMAEHINKLYEQTALAVQKIGLVRFNPFEDGGGNFSFTVALLDGHDNGVVITSMYGRQQNRIYTKKISAGTSENPLTDEEQLAIKQATALK